MPLPDIVMYPRLSSFIRLFVSWILTASHVDHLPLALCTVGSALRAGSCWACWAQCVICTDEKHRDWHRERCWRCWNWNMIQRRRLRQPCRCQWARRFLMRFHLKRSSAHICPTTHETTSASTWHCSATFCEPHPKSNCLIRPKQTASPLHRYRGVDLVKRVTCGPHRAERL